MLVEYSEITDVQVTLKKGLQHILIQIRQNKPKKKLNVNALRIPLRRYLLLHSCLDDLMYNNCDLYISNLLAGLFWDRLVVPPVFH